MNVMDINDRSCERYRSHIDAYLDNELPVETSPEILRHFESCSECAGIIENRDRMKHLLRCAVNAEGAPVELVEALRNSFRIEEGSL
jgi:anti-sigma factor (TIGR02949 family)